MVEKAVMVARVHEYDVEVRQRVGFFRRQLRRVEARGTDLGDRISWFSLRETEEHA